MTARHVCTTTVLTAVLALGALAWSGSARGDETPPAPETGGAANPSPPAPDVPMLAAAVRVTDAEGRPIAGAVVKPFGLRTRKEPGSHYGWRDDLWGPVPTVTTGADGIAEVPVPKYVYEEMETGMVTWWVDHPRYVVFWEDRPVGDRPADVVLQDGVLIAVRALDDTTGRPVVAPFALISGSSFGDEWTLQDDGSLVSRAVSQQRRLLRVMHLPPDRGEPALFSELIDLARQGGLALDLTVRVKPGVRVRGRLDEAVPRPVTNARVTAMVIGQPAGAVGERLDYEARWQWQETADVAPDGNFDLGWLPAGEPLQFLAVCDGFVSRNLTPQELDAARTDHPQLLEGHQAWQDQRIWPRLAALTGAGMTLDVPMEPTAKCRVTIVDSDNLPVPGASVRFSPNQAWYRGGSQSLGWGVSQSHVLRAARDGEAPARDGTRRQAVQDAFRRYQAMSDENGVALVTDLPALGEQSFSVKHPTLELPASRDPGFRRSATANLTPGTVAEVTVRLEPKGTRVIGRGD
jgi:hypothetical protein